MSDDTGARRRHPMLTFDRMIINERDLTRDIPVAKRPSIDLVYDRVDDASSPLVSLLPTASRQELARRCLAKGDTMWLVRHDQQAVGWAWAARRSAYDRPTGLRLHAAPDACWAYDAWVHADYRKTGLTRYLFFMVFRDLQAEGYVRLHAAALDANRASLASQRLVGMSHVQTAWCTRVLGKFGVQLFSWPRRRPCGRFSYGPQRPPRKTTDVVARVPVKDRVHRLIERGADLVTPRLERLDRIAVRLFDKDRATKFFDLAAFPWVDAVEARANEIKTELQKLLAERGAAVPAFHEISPPQAVIADDDRWRTYFLDAFGERVEPNASTCPVTTSVVESIPGMRAAMFSILDGRSRLAAHRASNRSVLRYHLAVVVPEPEGSCRIRVGDQTRTWTEGGSLIFDDTFDHEVWNDSDAERVVLFVDFERPSRPPLRWLHRLTGAVVRRTSFVRTIRDGAAVGSVTVP